MSSSQLAEPLVVPVPGRSERLAAVDVDTITNIGTLSVRRRFSTAVDRWAGVGPYYAMFPTGFAFDVVSKFTRPGDAVLDPFAGRCTSVYAAGASGRSGLGIEINPVGWLYGRVKLAPAREPAVLARLAQIGELSQAESGPLPDQNKAFFRRCFSERVLDFLTRCRQDLDWRRSIVDATLLAIILVYLHGKEGAALSNQMRQGKSMSPDYSVAWWAKRDRYPPQLDPVAFLQKRVKWRYAKGIPSTTPSKVIRGDARSVLRRISRQVELGRQKRAKLLFTSPPYAGVTNYHADQWLRLWMMGGAAGPGPHPGFSRGRFDSEDQYSSLIQDVFGECASLLTDDASVYVRTDARPFTFGATQQALQAAFPKKHLTIHLRPYSRSTQTALFGDSTVKPGEVDLILQ